MAERTRVGLIFSYDENWIAGAYYIMNIVNALHLLPDEKKLFLLILSNKKEYYELLKLNTSYPFLDFCEIPLKPKYLFIEKVINKIYRKIFGKNLIVRKPTQPDIEFLYPSQIRYIKINGLKKVNWIPDFQEEFLPKFFSEEEIVNRKIRQKKIIFEGDVVVLSSKNAKEHFEKLYPKAKATPFVLPFAVTLPDISKTNFNKIKDKYQLPEKYFFTPNQFWAHKNHNVILKSVKQLKDEGKEIYVVFSGKESDYRSEHHIKELKQYINDNNLSANIFFLGFIDRKEQLCILKNSIAVIQPSLFEGWSTVVEDCKSMGKHVVLSDIQVHREQIQQGVSFFNPNNSIALSDILTLFYDNPPKEINHNYQENILTFANNFLALVEVAKR